MEKEENQNNKEWISGYGWGCWGVTAVACWRCLLIIIIIIIIGSSSSSSSGGADGVVPARIHFSERTNTCVSALVWVCVYVEESILLSHPAHIPWILDPICLLIYYYYYHYSRLQYEHKRQKTRVMNEWRKKGMKEGNTTQHNGCAWIIVSVCWCLLRVRSHCSGGIMFQKCCCCYCQMFRNSCCYYYY